MLHHSPNNFFSDCRSVGDLVFVIDGSGSIDGNEYQAMKDSIEYILERIPIEEDRFRIGAVQFARDAETEFRLDFTYDRQVAINRIQSMTRLSNTGATNTAAGIDLARNDVLNGQNGDRPDVNDVMLIVTDGRSNVNPAQTIPSAIAASEDCITVLVLGLGNNVLTTELSGKGHCVCF